MKNWTEHQLKVKSLILIWVVMMRVTMLMKMPVELVKMLLQLQVLVVQHL